MNSRVKISSLFLSGMLLLLSSCDEGLKPTTSIPTGSFVGIIRFTNWQAADSIYDMRLVAFKNFPPRDVVNEVLSGNAAVYPPLGGSPLVLSAVDSLTYSVTVPATVYKYVVVAQQYGPDIMANWKPVGQYDLDSNFAVPSSIVVAPNHTTSGVDITVDFAHPPPPPF